MQRRIQHIFVVILFTILFTRDLTAATNWTQLTPTPPLPSPRYTASMAFDPISGQLILFGGYDGSYLNDTWGWDGTNWNQLTPVTTPPARSGAVMAYDSDTQQLILFGGYNGIYLNDTWNWDGTNWNLLTPATSPPALFLASMAFDSSNGQLILFGGATSSGYTNETWNWDGTDWTQLSPATSPPIRGAASMEFDPTTGQLILFGGYDGSGFLNDTWNWDGTNWTLLTPATSPSTRAGASMAFDTSTDQLILFGGSNVNETWNWDGTNWVLLTPATSPPARTYASIAFDPVTEQLILFGGRSSTDVILNDTWTWGIVPVATATPTSQTICSGNGTSISLSSDIPGTTFSWTVSQNGVVGASNGSGSTIAQILTTTSSGTAIYTVTPTSPGGDAGSPIIVTVTVQICEVETPKHFRGKIKCNQFATQTDIIHLLSWEASSDPDVIGYKIFQNGKLIKTINKRTVDQLQLHNREKNKIYHYEIIAFTASGDKSLPAKLNL